MDWFVRIVISAMATFMTGISILLAYFGVSVFYQQEIAQLPPVEAGSLGPAFSSLISAIIIGLSVMPVLFIIFLIFYKRLNLLGLLLGAGFAF
ncbi:hypothetical protein [Planococcus lenghuensis]|uniref:Major facilitator superfamily (MFS) profile domain-containing protein n=1 Tax=Planococcus lenghuensis TaxID=2213202 RepID=A0A1Q2L0W1_9BACL|nr:hypothetical protein [Planococcus lenghuensis]AQQ54053.1 hypothetical protein B0X71_13715 [Planococcus lenghuensis]